MCSVITSFALNTSEIYCPNCGESGHHCDFPLLTAAAAAERSINSNNNNTSSSGSKRKRFRSDDPELYYLCMEPKHDAFMKFPQCKLMVTLLSSYLVRKMFLCISFM